jgi:hypothetical protein
MPVSLYAVSLDCANAKDLAAFWAAALDRTVDEGASEEFAAIGLTDPAGHATQWMFHKVPEGKTAKNRFHPDLVTPDLEGDAKRLLDLGAARLADIEEGGFRWVTLSDPEGNEFDLVATEG